MSEAVWGDMEGTSQRRDAVVTLVRRPQRRDAVVTLGRRRYIGLLPPQRRDAVVTVRRRASHPQAAGGTPSLPFNGGTPGGTPSAAGWTPGGTPTPKAGRRRYFAGR